MGDSAGTAYLVHPDAGTGPGLLFLHSWWGLTAEVKRQCDELAADGFVVLAPDLMEGRRPETSAEAEVELAELDPNRTAALLLSSVVALRSQTDDPDGPVAVLGYSMGASWAMWLATRQPDSIRAVVIYYGTQDIDFSDLRAPVLGHFAADDPFADDNAVAYMEAQLRLAGKSVTFHRYENTTHWFAEADREAYVPTAASLAWGRTVSFLSA